ncbi:membrane fusion protein, multidrug efflux system [Novimethylophilus kurashikiensis]|uniref:Membrane fusion protein, multidrug efflux system n=1 Tax=Novimethylophilus kurashikiensis TaxID=1825523 RepID=A0A2R5F3J8_9PROT|nr:HlyD family efflux transporter periplasmic adaptor subunit [Novimethylophilus kurashikiensis]GBG13070.1 membrane fusion protein, multidrug efflux system [Novimethylophilus kurashikiensis]
MSDNKVRTRYHRLRYAWALMAVAGVGSLSYWYLFLRPHVVCDDAYVMGNIIPVQALVPGIVVKVNVDNSMYVEAGQPLLSQELHLMTEQLEKSAANLAEAVRKTRSQFSEVQQTEAELASLKAQRAKIADDLARYRQAEAEGAIAGQKVADAVADLAILDQQILAAEAKTGKSRALVANTTVQNNPWVLKEKAEYVASYIQCHRTTLRSPVSGYVANRRVQTGQNLTPGQLLMNVVPLKDLWVTANIKETDMKNVSPGQDALITAHIYDQEVTYHGKVLGIEPAGGSTFSLFPPDNSTGNYIHIVERVPVRISIDSKELTAHPLRPGMSVTVEIQHSENNRQPHLLASAVNTDTESNRTSVYERELSEALSQADNIIRLNASKAF